MAKMGKSDSLKALRRSVFSAKGQESSQLRARRAALKRRFGLPDDLLGGSLVLGYRSCGKPACRCAEDDGHPQWTLTYSVDGTKRVENIPAEMVEALVPLVEKGQGYRDAVNEIRSINAQLLRMWRLEQRAREQAGTQRKARSAQKKPHLNRSK